MYGRVNAFSGSKREISRHDFRIRAIELRNIADNLLKHGCINNAQRQSIETQILRAKNIIKDDPIIEDKAIKAGFMFFQIQKNLGKIFTSCRW